MATIITQYISSNIRSRAAALGLTLPQVARRAGLRWRTFKRILFGLPVTPSTFRAVAVALDTTPLALEGNGEPNAPLPLPRRYWRDNLPPWTLATIPRPMSHRSQSIFTSIWRNLFRKGA